VAVTNSLALAPGERPSESLGRDLYRSGRRFEDFVVDGEPLRTILLRSERGGLAADLIPVLVWDWPIDRDVDTLLGRREPELGDGRVSLYVCPECGDLGCGAVTAVIERDGGSVRWRDLAYQNDYEPLDDELRLRDVGPFSFDRNEYEAMLEGARRRWVSDGARYRSMAEPARWRGRFRFPSLRRRR